MVASEVAIRAGQRGLERSPAIVAASGASFPSPGAAMSLDKWTVIEVVLTLTATGTLMWLVRKATVGTGFAPLLASLAGIALLVALFALDVSGAAYILAGLIGLIAVAFLLGMIGEM
jgi:hypothetical protein